MNKVKLVVVSHVIPFPQQSGQQQRVFYMLKALKGLFHSTFITVADSAHIKKSKEKLLSICDEVVLLPAKYSRNYLAKLVYKTIGTLYSLTKGLKLSNFVIDKLEFTPSRIAAFLRVEDFDCVLFEYWHAARSASIFRNKGIACILDMHDIQWQTYIQYLTYRSYLPGFWKRWLVAQYKKQEEQAWQQFDAIIAINLSDYEYVHSHTKSDIKVFYTPMGTDLKLWSYSWQPAHPPRIGYYGGLGGARSQRGATICYEQIMPLIWNNYPNAELWFIGNNPVSSLRVLAEKDSRVKVTGYVEAVQEVLKQISVIVCPWSGTYGFRSRLVEAMALGVPVVASPEAVYGMGMETGKGIFLEETPRQMAEVCLRLLRDREFASQQSRYARLQVEKKFSFEDTYGKFARELFEFILRFKMK